MTNENPNKIITFHKTYHTIVYINVIFFDDIYWIEKWRINFRGRKKQEIYYLHLRKNQTNNSYTRLYEPATSCSLMNLIVKLVEFY